MKFNDGFWHLMEGVKANYAVAVQQTATASDELKLQSSTMPIRHRGDTLKGPVLNITVHSPANNIIGVKIDHFVHRPNVADYSLFPDGAPPKPSVHAAKTDSGSSLVSGKLVAEVTNNPYTLSFSAANKKLTFAGEKYQGLFDVPHKWTTQRASVTSCVATDFSSVPNPPSPPEKIRFINSELNISPGELFYGLGEQFGSFTKNGQRVSIWNADGGTSSEQAYKCVPFYVSNRGYGVFVNHPGEVEFDVGATKVSRLGIAVAGESLEYFIIYGDTPIEILERYTLLTGRPALPPTWTFGLWLSTSFLTSYSSETVSGFLQGMRDRSCPVRVFHLDCFWMKQYEWCSFTFDPDNFPDPKQYLSEIKNKFGVKICVWINPYISQSSPIFQEGLDGGFYIKRTNGEPWQSPFLVWLDLLAACFGVVGFPNPGCTGLFLGQVWGLVGLGFGLFQTDFGERIPHVDVKFHDGSDVMKMHNLYSVIYNEKVFKLLEDYHGKDEAVVFARSGAAGGQRFPVHWGGDCESTFEAMAEATRGLLSLSISGYGYGAHDIGGFEGLPPAELYMRWVAFGMFSSHTRLHGSSSYRVPWLYGEQAAVAMSNLLEVKHRLMPYLYYYAIQAHQLGHPMHRTMFVEFPGDRTTHSLDRQYFLGRSLLVAPVFVPQGEDTEYYLPAGRWTEFKTGRTLDGPRWVKEAVALEDIPLWVRPGSVICLGPAKTGRPDYELARGLEVRVYELAEGETAEVGVPTGHGAALAGSVKATRKGGELIVETSGRGVELGAVGVFIAGVRVEGGGQSVGGDSRVVQVAGSGGKVVLKLVRV
ncbi:hypothetical protein EXIGLDRAFT_719180 [Exidia glandulosa HHB12029]|uniref:Uncharacterized protein n=1 Tax=Exidia glandulosa HHB12029 TaxID=1314781 RepID=A0A165H801_EXIGL|nr:hypothetical protein EXIGLDRAFT_719180 [Exidia glandulosa HHB12029]